MKHPNALTYGLGLLVLTTLFATSCNTDVSDIRGTDTADSASTPVLEQLGLRSGPDSSTTPGSNAPDSTRADPAGARQGRRAGDSLPEQGAPNQPPERADSSRAPDS